MIRTLDERKVWVIASLGDAPYFGCGIMGENGNRVDGGHDDRVRLLSKSCPPPGVNADTRATVLPNNDVRTDAAALPRTRGRTQRWGLLRLIRGWLLVIGILAATSGESADERDAINVADRKQLFVDFELIDWHRNIELVMNPPFQTGEKLVSLDQPYEEGGRFGLYSSVLKEPDGRVRIWYDVIVRTGSGADDYSRWVGYAESTDGVRFTKPVVGLHEVDGSSANNIVLPGRIGGASVWIDALAPAEHRYKTQAKVYPSTGKLRMYSSRDGLAWSHFGDIEPQGATDTQTIIFWDELSRRYLFYGRDKVGGIGSRRVRRAELTDLTRLENTGLVIWTDAMDFATYPTANGNAPVDYYGAAVFPYHGTEGVYIMLAQTFWHWMPGITETKLLPAGRDVRLAVSRDSKVFTRAGGRKAFLRPGPAGRFDSKAVWALPNPIVVGDEIWIYYCGLNWDRADRVDTAAPEGKRMSAISRAVMRLDGFVSADTPYEGGELTTRPLKFSGSQLELNIDTSAGGSVRVELLDMEGRPIPGMAGEDSPWLVGNSVRLPVTWSKSPDLRNWTGKPVRLRFIMRDCKLYAFQFRK
jgi:hypothetical protein